jgi:hypothetical protein
MFLASRSSWLWFNQSFLAGELPIYYQEKIAFVLQVVHLFIYLMITWRWIQSAVRDLANTRFVVSAVTRIIWIKQLSF